MLKFNEEIKVVQKKLMDFQNQNMQVNAAATSKDTTVITMKGYSDIQAEVGAAKKDKNIRHMNHIPNQCSLYKDVVNDPSADIKRHNRPR
jgi:hypothetical protein